jgi:Tol biopolymer transport system component/predicted Ser/Thr protein kinase
MIGETIAHYRITAKIGEGGMGEVYRATDTKLHREVAIKVLPQSFAQDSARMARFSREAQVLASLNHPNIAQIYGVEHRALVMELVEGEALKGPLTLDTTLDYAKQIAEALGAAHEKGIVHRDLKPANIKVTPQGVVKVLDFGLAKAAEEQSGIPENSPTLTISPTRAGLILGTAAYMSPEQARGKPVDKRADIWAFGVVLYEMLAGQRLFKGDTISDTLAAVLKEEPDFEQVPIRVRRLLRNCLKKDRRQRLQAIGDWQLLVDEDYTGLAQPMARGTKLPWVVAAVVFALTAAAFAFIYFRQLTPQKAVLRYTIASPENTTNLHSFALSPDGHYVAISAVVNAKRQLWMRPLDALEAQPIPGTEDATYPFWSPDSRYIGFFAQGKLKKIAASGGPAQALCDAPDGRGGSWNRADVIVFSPLPADGEIQRVSGSGGAVTTVIRKKGASYFPSFLPDGHHFLYAGFGLSVEENGIYVASLDGKENRRILSDVSRVVIASGRLLFIRDNTVMAQALDTTSGWPVGEASLVAQGVSFGTVVSYAPLTVSDTGILLYQSGGNISANQMAWYDRSGKLLGSVGTPGRIFAPAISPDAKWIVFNRASTMSSNDISLRDLTRGTEQRLTTDVSLNYSAVWSPKGDRIAYQSNRAGGVFNLYQRKASATGQDELLLATGNNKAPTQWSRDGRFLIFSERHRTGFDIWLLPMEDRVERKPASFLRSEFNKLYAQLSPDGHWMAYTSDESGRREVYVRPFPAGEGQWPISIAGGEQPRWRGDGKELFFVGADRKMMAVRVKTSAKTKAFEPLVPEPLFEAHLAGSPGDLEFQYDVTADGKQFLLDTIAGGQSSAPLLNMVVNWDAGLKK